VEAIVQNYKNSQKSKKFKKTIDIMILMWYTVLTIKQTNEH